jgi:hypothetical protein
MTDNGGIWVEYVVDELHDLERRIAKIKEGL